MAKYKLILNCAEEWWTPEFDHPADTIEEAEKIASKLVNEYKNDYPDAYVAIFPYESPIKPLATHYPILVKDIEGDEYWMKMRVGHYGLPVNMLFLDSHDDIEEILEDYKLEAF